MKETEKVAREMEKEPEKSRHSVEKDWKVPLGLERTILVGGTQRQKPGCRGSGSH